jgi:uncharacterized protein YdeI (YjbR/CyaY-like superfamily)
MGGLAAKTKVYLLYFSYYDTFNLYGIFSTRKAAEDAKEQLIRDTERARPKEQLRAYRVAEVVVHDSVDEIKSRRLYYVRIDGSGNELERYEDQEWPWLVDALDTFSDHAVTERYGTIMGVSRKGYDAALELAWKRLARNRARKSRTL